MMAMFISGQYHKMEMIIIFKSEPIRSAHVRNRSIFDTTGRSHPV
jgi:hypothetical protein